MSPSIPSTHTYLHVPRYEVISKHEAQRAVGMPACDVPQRSDETDRSPDYALSATIVSGLGDEGLIGLAEQFIEARIRVELLLTYTLTTTSE